MENSQDYEREMLYLRRDEHWEQCVRSDAVPQHHGTEGRVHSVRGRTGPRLHAQQHGRELQLHTLASLAVDTNTRYGL